MPQLSWGIVLCGLWRRAQGRGGHGGDVACRGPKGLGRSALLNACPKPVPRPWNKFLPPFRAGPQLTIFGISTKVSLTHSTDSPGALKSAGIHSSSDQGHRKVPGLQAKNSGCLEMSWLA